MVEGLYYSYSESKGADQLRSYCVADLCLCFRICKKPVISQRGSFKTFQFLLAVSLTFPLSKMFLIDQVFLKHTLAGLRKHALSIRENTNLRS